MEKMARQYAESIAGLFPERYRKGVLQALLSYRPLDVLLIKSFTVFEDKDAYIMKAAELEGKLLKWEDLEAIDPSKWKIALCYAVPTEEVQREVGQVFEWEKAINLIRSKLRNPHNIDILIIFCLYDPKTGGQLPEDVVVQAIHHEMGHVLALLRFGADVVEEEYGIVRFRCFSIDRKKDKEFYSRMMSDPEVRARLPPLSDECPEELFATCWRLMKTDPGFVRELCREEKFRALFEKIQRDAGYRIL